MNVLLRRFFVLCGMMILGTGILFALDKLPTSGCQDRNNLTLLHRCDPYEVSFIPVNPERLRPRKSHRNYPEKVIPKARRYRELRRRTPLLERLVEKYIDYKERMLQRRPIPRGSLPGTVVGKREERIPAPNPEKKTTEINATREEGREKVGKEKEPAVSIERNESNASEAMSKPVGVAAGETGIESNVTEPPLPHPRASEVCLQRGKLPLRPEERESRISRGYPLWERWLAPAGTERGAGEKSTGPILYEVQKGDSFIGLARRYETTVYDLRKWNGLDRNHLLKIGEKLKIYPGKRSSPGEIKEAEIRALSGRYKVRKGDTLIGIAKRFGVELRKLRTINEMKKGSHIRLGQTLLLPIPQKEVDRILEKEKRKRLAEEKKKEKYRFKYVNDKRFKHRLRVIATAYTSHRGQTDKTPFIAAWNNRIRPGMKIIAVSNDLIRKYGITNGTKVKISGLPGIYTVRDKMHAKWRKKIDIYMGTNRRKALRWGRRRVVLYW